MSRQMLEKDEASRICDHIKLSDFNQIQSYGVLLVLDNSFHISQCSENVSTLLETSSQEILNQPIATFLKADKVDKDITIWLQQAKNEFERMLWQTNKRQLTVFVTLSKDSDHIFLEIELANTSDTITQNKMAEYMIADIQIPTCHNILDQCLIAAAEIKKLTGYNRVIIYQFDEQDQSGMVVGQALDHGMDSYLGLRFPGTDIPKPVRTMYFTQPFRYIPNIAAPNVQIIPERTLNLSAINLRMLAPIHAEYLSNTGVQSSCSLALIQDEKLWGLIIFHHQEARSLTLKDRRFLQFIAKNLIAQLSAIENATKLSEERRASGLEARLHAQAGDADSLASLLEKNHNDMIELVSATGMSMCYSNKIINYGDTPTNEQIRDLMQWLEDKNISNVYATSSLPLAYESSLRYKNKACGLLAIKMSVARQEYLMFYKPERVQTISWAGDPNKTLSFHESGYSPRNSFERYLSHILNTSEIWTERQIKSADVIQFLLTKQQLCNLVMAQIQAEKLTTVTMLAAGVAHEINNPLGYVINNTRSFTKRLALFQRMLGLVQGLTDSIHLAKTEEIEKACVEITSFSKTNNLTDKLSDVNDLVKESMEGLFKIQSIVNDMKSLISKPNENEKIVDINACVKFAITTVLKQVGFKFSLHQHFSESALIKGNDLQIQTVFVHLFKNAVQAIAENGEISVTTAIDNGHIVITFADNGRGIESENLKHLFSPFFTTQSVGIGRGLGLSLAYNIVKLHGGTITVKSEPGSGSVFLVRLPRAG